MLEEGWKERQAPTECGICGILLILLTSSVDSNGKCLSARKITRSGLPWKRGRECLVWVQLGLDTVYARQVQTVAKLGPMIFQLWQGCFEGCTEHSRPVKAHCVLLHKLQPYTHTYTYHSPVMFAQQFTVLAPK